MSRSRSRTFLAFVATSRAFSNSDSARVAVVAPLPELRTWPHLPNRDS